MAGGGLSELDKQKILDWLNRKWAGSKACTICGTNRWTLSDHIVAPMTSGPDGDISIGGVTYPQAMVICNNCGNTHYFNVAMMGIWRKEPKPSEDKSDG